MKSLSYAQSANFIIHVPTRSRMQPLLRCGHNNIIHVYAGIVRERKVSQNEGTVPPGKFSGVSEGPSTHSVGNTVT